MSYKVGQPPSIEATATRMYIASNRQPVHYAECFGVNCNECYNRGLHRVCPVCGSLLRSIGEEYTCGCGSMLYVCYRHGLGEVVTRFVPSQLFDSETAEDIV